MWTQIENIFLYILSMGAPTALLIVVVIQYFQTRHKERMAIIEKGGELPDASIVPVFQRKFLLKTGLFLIGISFGVLAAIILINLIPESKMEEETAYFITIPLFTGISLLVSYLIK
jgi:hypothetical protein